MSTKYSMSAMQNGEWGSVALFLDSVPLEAMIQCALAIIDDGAEDAYIKDLDYGEILWLYSDGLDNQNRSDDCDYEVGYDPYLGCYTDDC